jgi:hypothetical protein
MYKNIIILFAFLLAGCKIAKAQNELESMLEEEMGPTQDKVISTFLSTYVLNNQSVEMLNKKGLNFRISHKFGFLNSGKENFYGFDNSSVFMGIEYAPADWLNIGVGRGTFRESFNSMLKMRLLTQSTGAKQVPFSLVVYGELDYRTKEYLNDDLQNDKIGRIEYTSEVLLARKFGNSFSLQLMPGFIHRNLVETNEDLNDVAFIGFGGTYRILKTLRFNAEYFWVQDHDTPAQDYHSPFSAGICYQTSRHSFEVFATNSTGITSNNHIAYTTGNFWKGDICIGFNISIIFSLNR